MQSRQVTTSFALVNCFPFLDIDFVSKAKFYQLSSALAFSVFNVYNYSVNGIIWSHVVTFPPLSISQIHLHVKLTLFLDFCCCAFCFGALIEGKMDGSLTNEKSDVITIKPGLVNQSYIQVDRFVENEGELYEKMVYSFEWEQTK